MPSFNPIVTPQSLGQMNTVSPLYALQGDQAIQRGIQADQAGLADLLSSYQHEASMRPLKMQEQQISNDTGLARLPGVRAESSMKQRQNQMGAATFDSEKRAKLAEYAQKVSDAELSQFETQVKQMLYSRDPKVRSQGEQLWNASVEMRKIKDEQKFKASESQKDRQNRLDVANISAEARKASGSKVKSEAEVLAKMGLEKAIVYYEGLADAAEEAGNTQAAQAYRQKADMFSKKWIEGRQAAPSVNQGGKPDIGALADIPVKPTPEPTGLDRGVSYKTPEDIKSAYKSGKLTKEQATKLLQEQHGFK